MTRPGMWSHYDDGIVSGRLHRALYPCDVCGRMTACVWVSSYGDRLAKIYRSTIINLRIEPRRHHSGATTEGPPRLAVFLGLGCGCLAKLHRQVAHIEDSASRDREALYGGDQ